MACAKETASFVCPLKLGPVGLGLVTVQLLRQLQVISRPRQRVVKCATRQIRLLAVVLKTLKMIVLDHPVDIKELIMFKSGLTGRQRQLIWLDQTKELLPSVHSDVATWWSGLMSVAYSLESLMVVEFQTISRCLQISFLIKTDSCQHMVELN